MTTSGFGRRVVCESADVCRRPCGHKENHAHSPGICSRLCHRVCINVSEMDYYKETRWMDIGMKRETMPEQIRVF
jgi:hypothetical protein